MKHPTPAELADPVRRRELDREMIFSPDDWGQWPALPLKPRPPRTGTSLTETCAFIYWPVIDELPKFPLKIGLGSIFGGPRDTKVYDTVEDLLDDWTVD